MKRLAQLLDERFGALGVGQSNVERAEFLGEDEPSYSRLINGRRKLSNQRAARWATKLFPKDAASSIEFEKRLVEAGSEVAVHERSQKAKPKTVYDFCQSIIDEDGAVPVDRIKDLFDILIGLKDRIICVEYRDVPRAVRAAKYEGLGEALIDAISKGVSFAMFQPFSENPQLPSDENKDKSTNSVVAASYMRQVRDACRDAYTVFLSEARKRSLTPVDDRIRLYERRGDECSLGSGLQAKLFYVRYKTGGENNPQEWHERIFHWVSTPRQDLLVYRGERDIPPEAIRDSFYPVVHWWDVHGALPSECENTQDEELKILFGGTSLPRNYRVWKPYE